MLYRLGHCLGRYAEEIGARLRDFIGGIFGVFAQIVRSCHTRDQQGPWYQRCQTGDEFLAVHANPLDVCSYQSVPNLGIFTVEGRSRDMVTASERNLPMTG